MPPRGLFQHLFSSRPMNPAKIRLLVVSILLMLPLCGEEPLGSQVGTPAELKAWQRRRQESQGIITAGLANPGDPSAHRAMDALLSDYETHVLTRTPLENLDLIGRFYLPKDGVEKCLPVVVLNCVLGWYDALRFASESGRAEILNNERLYGRVYFLGGEAAKASVMRFAREHPERVKALVEQGIGFAEKFRNTRNYDGQWPTAFGLGRMIEAMGGSSEQKFLPESEWDKA